MLEVEFKFSLKRSSARNFIDGINLVPMRAIKEQLNLGQKTYGRGRRLFNKRTLKDSTSVLVDLNISRDFSYPAKKK